MTIFISKYLKKNYNHCNKINRKKSVVQKLTLCPASIYIMRTRTVKTPKAIQNEVKDSFLYLKWRKSCVKKQLPITT